VVEILEEIADECTNAGLVTLYRGEQLQSWMEAPLAALVDVTFMDDVVVIVDAPTARDLPRRSAQAAAIVFDAFATRGIRVNLQQHKTARMVATRGDGAQTALAELAQGDFPSIQVRSEVLGDMQVHVIRAYTHLGTVAEAQHRLKPELQHRNQSAKGALYPVRLKFYANPRIPMTPRGGILEADVLSRQLFNTAVWGPVAPGEDKKLRGEYAALLRPLPPGDLRSREAGVTHRALAAWTNRLPLPLVLAFAHLAHLCRICRDTDAQLTTVLQWETSVAPAGKSWLEHSLPCVQTVRCHLSPEHRQSWDVATAQALVAVIAANPIGNFKKLSRARRVARAMSAAYAAPWSLYDAIQKNAPDPAGQAPESNDQAPVERFKCPDCQRSFKALKALQAHRVTSHAYRLPHKQWAYGTCCLACGLDWHTRERVIRHWRGGAQGRRCYDAIRHFFKPMTSEQDDAMNAGADTTLHATTIARSDVADIRRKILPRKTLWVKLPAPPQQLAIVDVQPVPSGHAANERPVEHETTRDADPNTREPTVADAHIPDTARITAEGAVILALTDRQDHFDALQTGLHHLTIVPVHIGEGPEIEATSRQGEILIRAGGVAALFMWMPEDTWSTDPGSRSTLEPWGRRDADEELALRLSRANALVATQCRWMVAARAAGVAVAWMVPPKSRERMALADLPVGAWVARWSQLVVEYLDDDMEAWTIHWPTLVEGTPRQPCPEDTNHYLHPGDRAWGLYSLLGIRHDASNAVGTQPGQALEQINEQWQWEHGDTQLLQRAAAKCSRWHAHGWKPPIPERTKQQSDSKRELEELRRAAAACDDRRNQTLHHNSDQDPQGNDPTAEDDDMQADSPAETEQTPSRGLTVEQYAKIEANRAEAASRKSRGLVPIPWNRQVSHPHGSRVQARRPVGGLLVQPPYG